MICLIALVCASRAFASPLSDTSRARLARGEITWVIVEYDVTVADRAAETERARRRIGRDDAAILTLRSQAYRRTKIDVEGAVTAPDATLALDYEHFGLAVWRIDSTQALERLQSHPGVRAIHENTLFHPVSVSDLPFINQPQVAAQGVTGAGTTVAVIDGGLGNNYLSFSDFGTCTGVNTPASTCRVVYNRDFFPGGSAQTVHGTNVSAIALGVAPGARLAMFNVFNGSNASAADILSAMNTAISLRPTYNIVAMNLSLGDGGSNATQCAGSVFNNAVNSAFNAGILAVIAAGNNGSKTGLSDPACVPNAVSVGAVYDASYGNVSWLAPSAPGGACTDASAPDKVTCFSQSASYLSLLAPGSFVNAPSTAFQQTGTSQATPHIAGAVAVLRARYPSEPLAQTVQRMKISGVADTDASNSTTVPRLNLLAAVQQGTAISLTGAGPSNATAGTNSTYTLVAHNTGPLMATNVIVTNMLPAGATFVSASAGCVFASGVVTCSTASLASGSQATFTITVRWQVTGPVYDSASVIADQNNIAPPVQQRVSFGQPVEATADAPLPAWAYVLLGLALFAMIMRRTRVARPELAH
ncbi:MAG: S8 family serine peptidase [Gammaproteobacteria bacterium]